MNIAARSMANGGWRRRFLLFGAAYIALWVGTWYSARLLESVGIVSLWFLPAGLRFFCLLVFGWRGIVLELAVQAVFALMQVTSFEGVPIAEFLSTNTLWRLFNLLGSLVATAAVIGPLRRLVRASWDLTRPSHSALLLFAALVASALSALVGTFSIVRLGGINQTQFTEAFASWLIGDFIGIITLTPLLLVRVWPGLHHYLHHGRWQRPEKASKTRVYLSDHTTFLIVGLALLLVFAVPWRLGLTMQSPLTPLLLLLPLAGIALSHGLASTVLATFLLDGGLVVLIALFDHRGESMSYQMVMITIAVMGLWLGGATDISNRLLVTRREVVAALGRYTNLYDYAPVGYFTLSRMATIVESNVEGARLLGTDRGRLKDQNFGDFVSPSTRPIFDAFLQTLFATGRPQTCEVDLVSRDEMARTASIEATLSTEVQECRAVVLDITEKKLAERALARYQESLENEVRQRTAALSIAKEAAEAANRAKSTFLTTVSHELRTPMSAIMGMTELARRKATDPKQIDQLTKATSASKHLLGIINDTLDFSKIEADKLTLDETDFQLSEIVEQLDNFVGYKTNEKGLKLTIKVPPEVAQLPLRGDPLRLVQILLNVIDNAIKFTDTGGIDVAVQLVNEDSKRVLLRFEIRDTGIGIADDDISRLFVPFEQLDGSLTRKYGGTGLGLAISRRLAQQMGGDIGVSSRPGVGSTFSVSVRLSTASSQRPACLARSRTDRPIHAENASEARLKTSFRGARILLVEDEASNQEVTRLLLEEVGMQVELTDEGDTAVAMAQRTPYSLILMDLQLPKLDGIEAARLIRGHPLNRLTPIVALTANAFEEERAACLAGGMNDHITKPVVPELLFDTLLKWLEPPRVAS